MDDLERRVLTLELEARHERELAEWRFSDLSLRLQALEKSHIPFRMTAPGLLKLLIAIALPVAVLLGTGDLRKALAALRLMVAGWTV